MSSVIPAPIARQPWSMLTPLILLTCFGAAVLYSAAGGSFTPFASSHLIRFGIFMVVALVIAAMPRDFVKLVAYPLYIAVLLMLIAVETMGAMGGGRFQPRAWNAGRQALEVAAAKESYNQVSNMRLRGLQAILRREGLRPLRSTRAAREEIMSSRHGDDWRSLVT